MKHILLGICMGMMIVLGFLAFEEHWKVRQDLVEMSVAYGYCEVEKATIMFQLTDGE